MLVIKAPDFSAESERTKVGTEDLKVPGTSLKSVCRSILCVDDSSPRLLQSAPAKEAGVDGRNLARPQTTERRVAVAQLEG